MLKLHFPTESKQGGGNFFRPEQEQFHHCLQIQISKKTLKF